MVRRSGELGSLFGQHLVDDYQIRFLNWAAKYRCSYKGLRILGLGEGTGVTSLALAADGAAEVRRRWISSVHAPELCARS